MNENSHEHHHTYSSKISGEINKISNEIKEFTGPTSLCRAAAWSPWNQSQPSASARCRFRNFASASMCSAPRKFSPHMRAMR